MLIPGQLRVNPGKEYLVLVNSEDTEQERAITLWHEIVHLIKDAGGMPPEEQNEEEVEATAKKLAECCPEILQWAFHLENDEM